MHILIADDHTLFRDALVHYIQRAEPEWEISVAKDVYEVEEMLAHAQASMSDLIMLDYKMPGMKGLEGLRNLLKTFPSIPIALMSGLAEEQTVMVLTTYSLKGTVAFDRWAVHRKRLVV